MYMYFTILTKCVMIKILYIIKIVSNLMPINMTITCHFEQVALETGQDEMYDMCQLTKY